MVGLGGSVDRTRPLAVGLSCHHHLPKLYGCKGAPRDFILKIISLFFVCMYSVDFIPP